MYLCSNFGDRGLNCLISFFAHFSSSQTASAPCCSRKLTKQHITSPPHPPLCIPYPTLRFVSRAVCSSYSTLNIRRPSFSSRCRLDLEQSSAARHIRAVTSRLLHSLEDILLRAVLFIKLLSCLRSGIVIMDTLIVLLTYLLTYLSVVAFVQSIPRHFATRQKCSSATALQMRQHCGKKLTCSFFV